jgi:hypothetical protein
MLPNLLAIQLASMISCHECHVIAAFCEVGLQNELDALFLPSRLFCLADVKIAVSAIHNERALDWNENRYCRIC